MKTFAICLLATCVLGSKFLNEEDLIIDDGDSRINERPTRPTGLNIPDLMISQTIDLSRTEVDEFGYKVAPGETLDFILNENSSVG